MNEGLRVADLSAGYGAARVLAGVDVEVAPGEVVGIAGRNGVGKTTLLRAISAMILRSGGEVTLNGKPLPKRPDLVARMGVAHVPEGRRLFRTLTAEANLKFGALAAGQPFDRERLDAILEFFPIVRQLLSRPAGLLSGGEQQMVAIARGMMAEPKVLMVDELSLGLAPKATWDVMRGVSEMCRVRQMALLLVDQNVRALAETCDRLYVLDGGKSRVVEKPKAEDLDSWARLYF